MSVQQDVLNVQDYKQDIKGTLAGSKTSTLSSSDPLYGYSLPSLYEVWGGSHEHLGDFRQLL